MRSRQLSSAEGDEERGRKENWDVVGRPLILRGREVEPVDEWTMVDLVKVVEVKALEPLWE